jgi:hypothetical protein
LLDLRQEKVRDPEVEEGQRDLGSPSVQSIQHTRAPYFEIPFSEQKEEQKKLT